MSKSKNRANSKAKPKSRKAEMVTKETGRYANPSFRPIVSRNRPPAISTYRDGVRVCNTEQLLGVGLTIPLGTTKGLITMNPAGPAEFPWLHRLAQNYAKYRFRKLVISYVPYVGTTTPGFVGMGSVYDSEDAIKYDAAAGLPPLSSQPEYTIGPLYAGNSIRSHEAEVSSSNWLGIEFDCRRMSDNFAKWFYVDPFSSVSLGTGNEARLNQSVSCYLATQFNLPSAATPPVLVGSFYATYEIELIQPTSNSLQ